VLIILVTVFCLARHLLTEAGALLAEVETNASIPALGVFVFVICRVWIIIVLRGAGTAKCTRAIDVRSRHNGALDPRTRVRK
jgi:hypothetical protein